MLLADGVGMSPRTVVAECVALSVLPGNNQLGRTQRTYSLAFIGMRYSQGPSMLGSKSGRFGAKRRLSSPCSRGKYQRFLMPSLRGSTRGSTVRTTTTVTGGSIGVPESSLWKLSTPTLSNAKIRASGSHRTLSINYGWHSLPADKPFC